MQITTVIAYKYTWKSKLRHLCVLVHLWLIHSHCRWVQLSSAWIIKISITHCLIISSPSGISASFSSILVLIDIFNALSFITDLTHTTNNPSWFDVLANKPHHRLTISKIILNALRSGLLNAAILLYHTYHK